MSLVITALIISYCSTPSQAYEVVAHRGVHQEYHRDELEMDTCTANRIKSSTHSFLENTLESIEKAFEYGATMVEVDVHPTSEANPTENKLVVFHDWTLNCRTNASSENGCKADEQSQCVTDQQSWNYLKTLDIGYGYTADNGETFPFRGKGIGKMPTLIEAADLLSKHPNKKILINVKDKYERTQKLLLKELGSLPESIRNRIYVEHWKSFEKDFSDIGVQAAIYQKKYTKECLQRYFLTGWFGMIPKECHNLKFFIPLHQDLEMLSKWLKGIELTSLIWGWPNRFIEQMNSNGSEVYLSFVETKEDLDFAKAHAFSGIMTNHIEVIGPLLKGAGQ